VLDGRARSRFHELLVADVVPETVDASTFVLDVPDAQAATFAYRPGQFVNVRVQVDGEPYLRSYSMSSAPALDAGLRITVKRVPGGVVSNWLNDNLRPGDRLEVTPPSGGFVVSPQAGDLVAYAAGSGITPVLSIVAAELAGSDRQVSLLYANGDPASTIFAGRIEELMTRYRRRFPVVWHFDVDGGFVSPTTVAQVARRSLGAEHFVCGPEGFMATVLAALDDAGVDPARVHVERFTPADGAEDVGAAPVGAGPAPEVTVVLGGKRVTVPHRSGTTILQSARFADLRAPSSCESGTCATCMARVVDGEARMRRNEALTPDEVAEGWVLTCQAEPVSPSITVVYE
jgi:3-ketosteroid 9alpha-monooxygenase subunit B